MPLPPPPPPAPGRPEVAGARHLQLAVVIPAFNAAATVADVVTRVRASAPDAAVIVVDDGSSDGTGERAAAAGATVLRHPANRGKGAALASGSRAALGQGAGGARGAGGAGAEGAEGADIIVTLDADGQHAPERIPDLIAPIRAGAADLVLGARVRSGTTMPLARRLSNWLSAVLTTRIGGTAVADAQTGFRAVHRAVLERIQPAEIRYDYELAFLLQALRGGFRVVSVDVPTVYGGERSQFRSWSDTWRVVRVFLRHSRRIVLGAS